MRVALSHKFVLRSLLVAAAAVAFPRAVAAAGVAVAPWADAFVALGVGGVLGFFLSRALGRQFEHLRGVTDRIRALGWANAMNSRQALDASLRSMLGDARSGRLT